MVKWLVIRFVLMTYAWFTMSREVEVKNIQMTASVPEDIQISLGHIVNVAGDGTGTATQENASSYKGLAANEGILDKGTETDADDGKVAVPYTGNDAVSMLDWSNTADISKYYTLGKIIPASSTTGMNIFFTPDASGVGKSLKANAEYYQAANALSPQADRTTADNAKGIESNYKTELHAKTSANDEWSNYTTATAYDVTNHDGYYVDIPVWLRTSSTVAPTLSVDAYVTTNAAKDEDDLYLAARAAIIYSSTPAIDAIASPQTSGLLEIRKDNWESMQSIVDFMYSTNATGEAVDSITDNSTTGVYADGTHYAGTAIIPLNAGSNNTYGTPTKVIVRVWLEGEDPNCWNQNAGQDFNISLKFNKEAMIQTAGNGQTANYPAKNTYTKQTGDSTKVKVDDIVDVTVKVGTTDYAMKFKVASVAANDDPTWELYYGTYHTATTGKKHQINNTDLASDDTLGVIAWLNANAKTTGDIKNGITVTEANATAQNNNDQQGGGQGG